MRIYCIFHIYILVKIVLKNNTRTKNENENNKSYIYFNTVLSINAYKYFS